MPVLKKKFILDVLPLTRIPLTREQFFCYLAEKKIASGSLVSIPLFKRQVEGIVIKSRSDFKRLGGIELKKIASFLEIDFLTKKQLQLAQFIADYYIISLGIVMKNFIPARTKERKTKLLNKNSKIIYPKEITLTKEQLESVDKIIRREGVNRMSSNNFLLFGPASSGKTEVYIHSILKMLTQNKKLQFLILIPEKTLIPQALERYGEYFPLEEIVTLSSSSLTKGQYFTNWQKIKTGQAKIIIGTRMAVFAPFKKLGLIIIDEEQDISYKQWDMNPRYDARRVAEKLAELHRCKIVRGSATPNLESYWKSTQKKVVLLRLPFNQKIPQASYYPTKTTIIDMKKEKWTKNYSPISKKLQSEIAYALKNKQQIILFINRQGMSNFSVCKICKTLLSCPHCDRALIYTKNGDYQCTHCSYKSDILPKCSKCNSLEFRNIGLGTQKIEREIYNLFPSAKVLVADSNLAKKNNFQANLYQKFSSGQADILIGTQMISKGWDLPQVSLVGIIDTDNLLSFPDFSAEERAFQNIVQVIGRVNRPKAKYPGVAIIQSFHPENRVIQLASEKNYQQFWEEAIQERKIFKLPPFGKIIKLIFQSLNQKKVEEETEKVFQILNKLVNLEITEPIDPLVPRVRGKFRKQLIIKIPSQNLPLKLIKELKKLDSGWIIDVDPISTI